MAQLCKKLNGIGRSVLAWTAALTVCAAVFPQIAAATWPTVFQDPQSDARVLRTDDESSSPFDPNAHRLPDIVEMRLGKFQPDYPASNLFIGDWEDSGGFARLDVVFNGLINPPGMVAMSDQPTYSPYMYGQNPVFGFIELDVDANENTGGEIDFPGQRYLGNVARLGGLPTASRFSNRVAIREADLDGYLLSTPYVERSGEEFHLALFGEEIESINVVVEKPCGDAGVFDEGETWQLTGHWLHRAHCFEQFSLQCFSAEGRYMPLSVLQFRHSTCSNRTTVSLVFPLRNANCAQMQSPVAATQPNNGCPGDQFSIEEGLEDLRFSAVNVNTTQMGFPEFQLIADWAIETPSAVLNPASWRINACLGSAYPEEQSGNARFVWTDMYPNVVNCDFNGDGLVNIVDVQALQDYVSEHDGDPDYDADGNAGNNSIKLDDFSRKFCLFDSNYDGYVNACDINKLGDMNWDGVVACDDISDLALGLLNPAAYTEAYPGKLPEKHGDMDGNSVLDGRDIQLFVNYLLTHP